MNIIIAGIIGVAMFVGGLFTAEKQTPKYDGFNPSDSITLGAISYPTSLDSFTNPGATDSVATVSHSTQHSNANDAIEALQAKLGIGASTPTNGTVLAGTGAGSSAFTADPSVTTVTTSGLATLGSFISNASSTVIGNLNITGNATATSATTTNFFATTASSTSLYGAGLPGAGCTGSQFVQWSSGSFSCGTVSTGLSTFSTSTSVQMATTTISSSELPDAENLVLKFISPGMVGTSATSTAEIWIAFNYDTDSAHNSYAEQTLLNVSSSAQSDQGNIRLIRSPSGNQPVRFAEMNITNIEGVPKFGSWNGFPVATTTGAINWSSGQTTRIGQFTWATTTPITRIDIWPSSEGVYFATGTKMTIMGY